jgi:histidinol-phosphate phosphatase family protein
LSYDVVIPSAGRESLNGLLTALASGDGPPPERVIVVDDRRNRVMPLRTGDAAEVLPGPGRGPAAARNVGWRAATAPWVVFLDDDVTPPPDWRAALRTDLAGAGPQVGGSQGRIVVPLPADRRPTDWERNVRGLESANWATADMAFRRRALQAVGGFDERFTRAYREDADIALRMLAAGLRLQRGNRSVLHPVRPAGAAVSLRLQAGNADDALMNRLHGPDWRQRAGAPRGRLRHHLLACGAGLGAVIAPHGPARRACLGVWAAQTIELAVARIAPGPRTASEITRMLWTSALMPPVASWHRLRGELAARREHDRAAPRTDPTALPPLAVLLDRDGTLVQDVPYNCDPARVRPLPGVEQGLERLRADGVALAVVSNQSGVGRGWISDSELAAVNARIVSLLGPLGPWLICPHTPEAGCDCRKPAPGLILQAAARLDVPPWRCAMIGDIGTDVEAARRAGARAVLVPTSRTRQEEIEAAPERADSFMQAVDRLLGASPTEELLAA